ncbi:MAG TPA: bifunctional aspartate kinase/homoserine dehydrogenase I [Woeseiaceae bacterium]|nr:bifunctional aspartate kinase/homoserine dehydrogenase I [Woeseiaceae bacterium]
MAQDRWTIHKFGGSSLADADCFRNVADILSKMPEGRTGIVVSAMGGMTDKLLRLTAIAERDDRAFADELHEIGDRYTQAARRLLNGEALVRILDQWGRDAGDIRDILRSIALVKSAAQRSRDIVAGYGEIWSARLMAAFLAQTFGADRAGHWIDARRVITIRHSELGPAVIWEASQRKWQSEIGAKSSRLLLMTGFIASDEEGLQTTLGRNGSDFSAAIFAALADASELTIWTDVDGVMSADPRRVPEARIIESLSYNEAMELAYFGAKVIHPQTMGPAVRKSIPIVIRNTFNPGHPGSRIQAHSDPQQQIKGITAVSSMALVNLEGAGMIGVPGTADRLFAALKNAGVSVTLISQASSEHSICIAVPDGFAERARDIIAETFAEELAGGQIQSVDVSPQQSIVAVVGDGMAGTPGIAAKFFGTLGRAGINIRAIAQGSSERNISAVVDSKDVTRALRAVHSGFYLSLKTLSIGLIGPGSVGGTLLEQIHGQRQRLAQDFGVDLRIRAIARSQSMYLEDRCFDLRSWRQTTGSPGLPLDFEAFENHVHAEHLPHAVIIDCSASNEVAARYAGWLERGIHIVTPNKKAFSGPYDYYRSLRAAARSGNAHYLYETTVGAALPLINTMRDLMHTGDRIHSVAGILSGTLAYLFNVYDGRTPFSEIVRNAMQSGYTEPDPRDDLSGMDVARKLTIIAREMGLAIELGQFPVQNLIPGYLQALPTDEFLLRLPEHDRYMQQEYEACKAESEVLRYVARLDAGGNASVGLERLPAGHAFARISLTDNIVQFNTDRYMSNPLIVQGPGAGPDVTAGGVFADLLRLAAYIGDGSM